MGFGGAPQCFLSRSPRGSFRGHDEGNLIGRNNKRIGMKQTPGCAGTAGELPGGDDRPGAPIMMLISAAHSYIHPSRHRAIAPSRHRAIAPLIARLFDTSTLVEAIHRHRHGTSRPTRCTRTQWGVLSTPWAARASRAAPACRRQPRGVRWHRLPPRERAPAPSTAAPFQAQTSSGNGRSRNTNNPTLFFRFYALAMRR